MHLIHPFYMRTPQSELIGAGDVIREISEEIEYAARSDAKVLITGEGGVGKTMVARMIHERSRRGQSRLIPIQCAGVPDPALDAGLFGHRHERFTDAHHDGPCWLEQAQGGTIVIDDIGEMSLHMQTLLLRFLENGEVEHARSGRTQSVDVRVIAATRGDLLTRIAEKQFRADLFYRLNMFHIQIPPLRVRRGDIAALLSTFVRSYCQQHRVAMPVIPEDVLAQLVSYDWPGNVRELKNTVEHILVQSRGTIRCADLPNYFTSRGPKPVGPQGP